VEQTPPKGKKGRLAAPSAGGGVKKKRGKSWSKRMGKESQFLTMPPTTREKEKKKRSLST